MGRNRTTGRFTTRADLVERVQGLYYRTDMSMSSVARHCGVSQGCANAIIESREWETLQASDFDPAPDQMASKSPAAPLGDSIPTIHAGSCGDGYSPPDYPVHLPDQVKNDLDLW